MARPVLFVLAGVNGAGKSSIGGYLLARRRLSWFNPDAFARELIAETGCNREAADVAAWTESVRRLNEAVASGRSHAFETTLAGRTIATRLRSATSTHDVVVWFIGLTTIDQHLARIRLRASAGGHDIPERAVRRRWLRSPANLVALMPHLAHLTVFDNSADVAAGDPVPDPRLILQMEHGRLVWPTIADQKALGRTPDWAKPLLEAALSAGISGR